MSTTVLGASDTTKLPLNSPGSFRVRGGRADVALMRDVCDWRGLDHELLLTEPRRAVLSRRHRLAQAASLTRAELLAEPVPTWAGARPGHARFRAAVDHLPDVPVPTGPRVTDYSQLVEVVALGMGVAFLAASTEDLYPRPDLVYVPVSDVTPSSVHVVWPSHSTSRPVAAFVRAAVQAARTGLPQDLESSWLGA